MQIALCVPPNHLHGFLSVGASLVPRAGRRGCYRVCLLARKFQEDIDGGRTRWWMCSEPESSRHAELGLGQSRVCRMNTTCDARR